MSQRSIEMPLGVVIRREPGVTRWAKWVWRAVAVLPGAGQESWKELRRDGDCVEYHAATLQLELFRTDCEAYMVSLSMTPPTVFVVLRENDDPDSPHPYIVHRVTVSAYEAQDYTDSGEEIVEPVAMPPGLVAWVHEYTKIHFEEEEFIKRRRDKKRTDLKEDGIGDVRIRQGADVYRSPNQLKSGQQKPDQLKSDELKSGQQKPKETLH